MKRYKHRQIGHWLLYGLIVCAALIFAVDVMVVGRPIGLVSPAVLLLGAAMFSSMTITIERGILCARFGPGPAWKRIRVSEIAACEPTRIRWWYGWGTSHTAWLALQCFRLGRLGNYFA
ncbi:MAG: hypothetical protein ACR2MF_01345 [Chthoniobacterales bacterium]